MILFLIIWYHFVYQMITLESKSCSFLTWINTLTLIRFTFCYTVTNRLNYETLNTKHLNRYKHALLFIVILLSIFQRGHLWKWKVWKPIESIHMYTFLLLLLLLSYLRYNPFDLLVSDLYREWRASYLIQELIFWHFECEFLCFILFGIQSYWFESIITTWLINLVDKAASLTIAGCIQSMLYDKSLQNAFKCYSKHYLICLILIFRHQVVFTLQSNWLCRLSLLDDWSTQSRWIYMILVIW